MILNGKRDFIPISYLLLNFELYCFSRSAYRSSSDLCPYSLMIFFLNGHITFLVIVSVGCRMCHWAENSCKEVGRGCGICVLLRAHSLEPGATARHGVFTLKTASPALCVPPKNSREPCPAPLSAVRRRHPTVVVPGGTG